MSVNKVFLLGNLTKDPQMKTFQDGNKNASFAIAVNKRGFKTRDGREIKERVDYINVVCRNGLADVAEKYLHKGDKIHIIGELKTGSYEKDGVKHYTTDVLVSELEMLSTAPKENRASEEVNGIPVNNSFDGDDLPF